MDALDWAHDPPPESRMFPGSDAPDPDDNEGELELTDVQLMKIFDGVMNEPELIFEEIPQR